MAGLAQVNKEAFDHFAATYDISPWQLKITNLLTTSLQERKGWLGVHWSQAGDERTVKLLDYACGTGAASIALKPLVSHITGMDVSEGMITKYNETMSRIGLTQAQAHGIVVDLADPACKDLQDEQYDVAIISLALHHVNNAEQLLKALVKRLRPSTGVLIVVDFLPFEHSPKGHKHKMAHTIKQHGFTQEQMTKLYEDVGLKDFGFCVVPERVSIGDDSQDYRDMFIARGSLS